MPQQKAHTMHVQTPKNTQHCLNSLHWIVTRSPSPWHCTHILTLQTVLRLLNDDIKTVRWCQKPSGEDMHIQGPGLGVWNFRGSSGVGVQVSMNHGIVRKPQSHGSLHSQNMGNPGVPLKLELPSNHMIKAVYTQGHTMLGQYNTSAQVVKQG